MVKEEYIEINNYEDIKALFGNNDVNKLLIESKLDITINVKDNNLVLIGSNESYLKQGILFLIF